jgi:ATP-binding cassette subfamily F protein 3
VALIGPNGAGKTTFLKTLLGEVEPLSGDVRLGANLQIGYFAQAHAELTPEHTVIEEILDINPRMKQSQARNFLARFLFSGDSVDKPIEILSGGERGRVALAKLALEGSNFLLLDEPTNHLDIPSQEVLEHSLESYPGTILLVSHDRYLIDALATQVWVITPTARELGVFSGGYRMYLDAKRERVNEDKIHPPVPSRRKPELTRPASRADLVAVEARLEELERELAQIVRQLESAGDDLDQIRLLGNIFAELESEIEAQFAVWESLAQDEALA